MLSSHADLIIINFLHYVTFFSRCGLAQSLSEAIEKYLNNKNLIQHIALPSNATLVCVSHNAVWR